MLLLVAFVVLRTYQVCCFYYFCVVFADFATCLFVRPK